MESFLERLEEKVLIFMGAVSTNLQTKGLDLGKNSTEWLINHPGIFQSLLKEYVDIGCDIISAASTAANRFKLEKYGLQDKTREFNFKLASLAKEVTPKGVYLAATLGPVTLSTGRFLQPLGDLTFEEVYESYKEQVEALAEGGVDLFWILTMVDVEEAGIAVRAVKDCTSLPVIATMAFDSTSKGFRTMMGVDPKTAAQKLQEMGADAVGTNCGSTSIEDTTGIIQEMREACNSYLAAKPNAGMPSLVEGKPIHPVTPEQMAKEMLSWVDAGARIVSGCCGTTTEHIAEMIALLNQKR